MMKFSRRKTGPLLILGALLMILSTAKESSLSAQSEPEKTGKTIEGTFESRKVKPGTVFSYAVYLPKQYDGSKPAALAVSCDGLCGACVAALEKLADEGAAPVTICVGVVSGSLTPTVEGGFARGMRGEEYDQAGGDYADFLVDELIPALIEKEGLNIDPDPNRHLTLGASSGGIAAWEIAWRRNDYFRRAYLNSPTFSAFRGGEEVMYRVRISETRPIRSFVTVGCYEKEPNIYAGNSYITALFADDTLRFAGYETAFEEFPDGPHGAGYGDAAVAERVMRFLWADWETRPVRPLRNPDRVERLVTFGESWEETDEPFPNREPVRTKLGVYHFEGGNIFFTPDGGETRRVSDRYRRISALAVSSDLWRLYVADLDSRFVDAVSIQPDGSLGEVYRLAPLRLGVNPSCLGAADLCVDTRDRVYAATELGIQGIISFGIVDAILPLPGDAAAEKIAFGGEENRTVYVKSGEKVFKRTFKTTGRKANDPIQEPGSTNYFN